MQMKSTQVQIVVHRIKDKSVKLVAYDDAFRKGISLQGTTKADDALNQAKDQAINQGISDAESAIGVVNPVAGIGVNAISGFVRRIGRGRAKEQKIELKDGLKLFLKP